MLIQNALEDAGATSFHIVEHETDTVISARYDQPAFITSDVKLNERTGPAAARIHDELSDIPAFVTATPDACMPCNPPGSVLAEPFASDDLERAFRKALTA